MRDNDGNPISEETVGGLGAVEEFIYVLKTLDAREGFRYTVDIELSPENQADKDELRDRFM